MFKEDSIVQKTLPHSLEAEQAVLGALLLDAEAFDKIADILTEEDFLKEEHRLIFLAITRLVQSRACADVITVSEHLERQGALERAGGLKYLGLLAEHTPSSANIRGYAEIVRERAILRSLLQAANGIVENVYRPQGRRARELLDEAESRIMEVAQSGERQGSGLLRIPPLIGAALAQTEEVYYAQSQAPSLTGVASGFADLDDMTGGLQPGDLIIIAGRPSMGKTAFALNIAENAACAAGLPVAIFSMEMSAQQLVFRLMGSRARMDQRKLRRGPLSEEEWMHLTKSLYALEHAPIFIDDSPALNALELRSRARRLYRQEGNKLGAVIVDYLQLMTPARPQDNRANEISEMSRALKTLAKELHVPVLALSQLNRGLEARQNKRPMMADLRESGAIEQDADVILFIYRDEVYNPESRDRGTAEIIIGKQRNGPTGTVKLTFLSACTRFENHAAIAFAP